MHIYAVLVPDSYPVVRYVMSDHQAGRGVRT
jgi:hypothetical protein